MKETFYFTHDYNARSDEKIKKLIRKHWMVWYWLFWSIVEDLYQNANALRLDCEWIAFDMRVDEKVVQSILYDFDLFIIEWDIFGSKSVETRLLERDSKSSKARESARKRWDKKDANALRTESECNAIKEKKEKEKKEKEIIIPMEWEQALEVIEEFWDKEINNITEVIKWQVEFLWLIYKKWSRERERAKNILTWKDFWQVCEKANMSRIEFCKSIIYMSSKLDFWNGKIYNSETLYKHYAQVYNEAVNLKAKKQKDTSLITF